MRRGRPSSARARPWPARPPSRSASARPATTSMRRSSRRGAGATACGDGGLVPRRARRSFGARALRRARARAARSQPVGPAGQPLDPLLVGAHLEPGLHLGLPGVGAVGGEPVTDRGGRLSSTAALSASASRSSSSASPPRRARGPPRRRARRGQPLGLLAGRLRGGRELASRWRARRPAVGLTLPGSGLVEHRLRRVDAAWAVSTPPAPRRRPPARPRPRPGPPVRRRCLVEPLGGRLGGDAGALQIGDRLVEHGPDLQRGPPPPGPPPHHVLAHQVAVAGDGPQPGVRPDEFARRRKIIDAARRRRAAAASAPLRCAGRATPGRRRPRAGPRPARRRSPAPPETTRVACPPSPSRSSATAASASAERLHGHRVGRRAERRRDRVSAPGRRSAIRRAGRACPRGPAASSAAAPSAALREAELERLAAGFEPGDRALGLLVRGAGRADGAPSAARGAARALDRRFGLLHGGFGGLQRLLAASTSPRRTPAPRPSWSARSLLRLGGARARPLRLVAGGGEPADLRLGGPARQRRRPTCPRSRASPSRRSAMARAASSRRSSAASAASASARSRDGVAPARAAPPPARPPAPPPARGSGRPRAPCPRGRGRAAPRRGVGGVPVPLARPARPCRAPARRAGTARTRSPGRAEPRLSAARRLLQLGLPLLAPAAAPLHLGSRGPATAASSATSARSASRSVTRSSASSRSRASRRSAWMTAARRATSACRPSGLSWRRSSR